MQMRDDNMMMDYMRRHFDPSRVLYGKFANDIVLNIKNLGMSKVKNMFGKEFYISRNNAYQKEVVNFLSENDSQFANNYNKENHQINPYMNLNVIDKQTFMFVATKHFVPNKLINSMISNRDNDSEFDIYVYIFGKHSPKLIKNLTFIMDDIVKSTYNNVIYSVNAIGYNTDISSITLSKRKMDSLIYSHGELDAIKEHIDMFEANKEFYEEKQINYKTGILLYGNPGTGKSSLVKAIATEYHRAIVSVNMSNIRNIDFSRLTMMINNEEYEKYIVLFEDIDTIFLKREDNIEEERKELDEDDYEEGGRRSRKDQRKTNDVINDLLQFLDSTQSPSDVIFIATTNYINTITDALDGALVREGRFDLKLMVDELSEKDIPRFLQAFDIDPVNAPAIIEKYKSLYKFNGKFNQSKIQSLLLKTKGSFAIIDEEESTEEK